MRELYCIIDIGGTKILLLLVDRQGRVLSRRKEPTPAPPDPPAVVGALKGLLQSTSQEMGLERSWRPICTGVCTAGFVEHERDLVHQSPNLFWDEPVPLKKMLADALSCPVLIENDANSAVLGEVYYGAAIGHRDVVYVTISTGIGGGLFLDGKLYRGRSGFAGEIGHIKPFGRLRRCNCGGDDCLEIWASGTGIARSASDLWPAEAERGHISTAWVFEQAQSGNTLALEIVNGAAATIGRGLSNLITLFNPSCLVIGGGVVAGREGFFKQITSSIRREAIRPAVEITPLEIVPAKLEPEAGIWGVYTLLTGRAV